MQTLRPIFNSISDSKPGKWFNNKYQPAQKTHLDSRWNKPKFQNTSDSRTRTQFWHSILFAELMTLSGPTTGVTQSPSAMLPTPSEVSLQNGYSPQLDFMADQLTWMNIKPRFRIQFAVQTDDKVMHLFDFIWGVGSRDTNVIKWTKN